MRTIVWRLVLLAAATARADLSASPGIITQLVVCVVTPVIKKNAAVLSAALKLSVKCSIYFDTDFLNMRSIFSLIASMAVEFDCEVDNA
jgi:hypothetical protein